jgi:hypothetical protein
MKGMWLGMGGRHGAQGGLHGGAGEEAWSAGG